MSCPVTVHLGVYALGAAEAAERVLVESHLSTCVTCQTELARLEPLPELLARVPVHLLGIDAPASRLDGCGPADRITQPAATPGRRARAAARRWRGVVGMAAGAAMLGAAGGFWLAHPGASQPAANSPAAAITMSGTNPATHVRVRVTMTATSWGSSIRLTVWGLPLNQPCRLIVRSRAGATEVTGAWDAWRPGPVSVPASAAWRPADISSLRVATTSRSLVTLTAARPGARVRPSSLPQRRGQ
jgi:hypothetical protein